MAEEHLRTRSSSRIKQAQSQAKSDNHSKRQNGATNKPKTEDQCPVCLRNIKSKAAHCELGGHWVHYHCDKLTDDEISRLENDKDLIYTCKNCLSQNTCPKTVIISQVNSQSHSKSILQIPSISNPVSSATPAVAILIEETGQICGACDKNMDADGATCDTCKSSCHVNCMLVSDPEKCVSCGANEMQEQLSTKSTQQVEGGSPKQPSMLPCQPSMEPHTSQPMPVRHGSSDQSATAPKSVPAKSNKKEIDSNGNKQRELRQWDTKLRKWEEELKLREAKTNDITKEFSRLEEYVRKTEARNVELEKTVRTLQRKINLLEHDTGREDTQSGDANTSNATGSGHSHEYRQLNSTKVSYNHDHAGSSSLQSDQLIIGVREQVTQFIMSRVKSEFEKMERNFSCYPATQEAQPGHTVDIQQVTNYKNRPQDIHHLQRCTLSQPQSMNGFHGQPGAASPDDPFLHSYRGPPKNQTNKTHIDLTPPELKYTGYEHTLSARNVQPAPISAPQVNHIPSRNGGIMTQIPIVTNRDSMSQMPIINNQAGMTQPNLPHKPMVVTQQHFLRQHKAAESLNMPMIHAMYNGQPLIAGNTVQPPQSTTPFLPQVQPPRVMR